MAKVKRGNGEYTVANDLVAHYLSKGFAQIDETGKVIKQHEPQTIEEYREKVKALEAELAALKAAKAEAKTEPKAEPKAEAKTKAKRG